MKLGNDLEISTTRSILSAAGPVGIRGFTAIPKVLPAPSRQWQSDDRPVEAGPHQSQRMSFPAGRPALSQSARLVDDMRSSCLARACKGRLIAWQFRIP